MYSYPNNTILLVPSFDDLQNPQIGSHVSEVD